MVELAISLLGFLLLIFGIMDFSMAVYAQTFCYTEAQDGARWASVAGSGSVSPASATDIQTYVRSQSVGLSSSDITVDSYWWDTNNSAWGAKNTSTGLNAPGSRVKVVVSYPITPLSGIGIRTAFTAQATAITVINN